MDKSLFQMQKVIGQQFIIANQLEKIGNQFMPDITIKQWFLLIVIYRMDKEKSFTNIAYEYGSSRQNVTTIIKQLYKKGYVTYQPSQLDKRTKEVHITEQSLELFQSLDDASTQVTLQYFNNFSSDDIQALERYNQKCLQTLNTLSNQEME